ncbi:MAG TPA: nuclear transport factor 2 family protein [Longimicrobium sp.]|nr:nuclear transport factor 2 family protein [Longimicrobium sp.]
MAVVKEKPDVRDRLVGEYFRLIDELRSGVEGSVDRLVELWHPEGTFEFAGAPPVTGTYQGRNAIHVLYKNRFHSSGMPVTLSGAGTEGKQAREAALGVVKTEVQRSRRTGNKVVAGWTTVIGTADGRGFEVSGSHTFTFDRDRIRGLKVVITPRPRETKTLSMQELTVDDIGRLALAAWPVV